jgi:hypothetical protein
MIRLIKLHAISVSFHQKHKDSLFYKIQHFPCYHLKVTAYLVKISNNWSFHTLPHSCAFQVCRQAQRVQQCRFSLKPGVTTIFHFSSNLSDLFSLDYVLVMEFFFKSDSVTKNESNLRFQILFYHV